MELNNKIYTIEDFLTHQKGIKNYCWRLMGRDNRAYEDGDELFSMVIVATFKLLDKKSTYDSSEHFRRTLMQLTRFTHSDLKRYEKIRSYKSYDKDDKLKYKIEEETSYNGDEIYDFFESEKIHDILKGLSYYKKKIVYLLYQGYERKEISELLGVSINTLRDQIYSIQKQLKNRLYVQ